MAACQMGGLFSKCGRPPLQTCQYCGRSFCAEHAYYTAGHESVCIRKWCRLKRDDMVVHLAYGARVGQRNNAGLCGVEGCEPHPRFQCSMCNGRFCQDHVREGTFTFRESWSSVDRRVSVCPHCWHRRKIWRRMR